MEIGGRVGLHRLADVAQHHHAARLLQRLGTHEHGRVEPGPPRPGQGRTHAHRPAPVVGGHAPRPAGRPASQGGRSTSSSSSARCSGASASKGVAASCSRALGRRSGSAGRAPRLTGRWAHRAPGGWTRATLLRPCPGPRAPGRGTQPSFSPPAGAQRLPPGVGVEREHGPGEHSVEDGVEMPQVRRPLHQGRPGDPVQGGNGSRPHSRQAPGEGLDGADPDRPGRPGAGARRRRRRTPPGPYPGAWPGRGRTGRGHSASAQS